MRNRRTRHIKEDLDIVFTAIGAPQAAGNAGERESPPPGTDQRSHVEVALKAAGINFDNAPMASPSASHPDAPFRLIGVSKCLYGCHRTKTERSAGSVNWILGEPDFQTMLRY